MFSRFKQIVDQHLIRAKKYPPTRWDAIIKVRGHSLTVLKVTAVTVTGNYAANMADLYHLTIAVPFRENRLLLNRAYGDVQVKLLRKAGTQILETINLKGVVISNRDDDMESPTMFTGESDDKAFALAQLELMEESFWNLRAVQVGEIYRKMTPLDVARSILAKTLPSRQLSHGEVLSVEYDKEEQTPYQSIAISDDVEFSKVFDYLQDSYGIYSSGLGVYLQKDKWHLFRPYYPGKFEESDRKLVIYNLPKEQAGELDESLVFTETVRTIITGGSTRAFDYQDHNALNSGTGYRAASIRALDGRMVTAAPGKVAFTASEQIVSQANPNTHASGIGNAKVLSDRFVDHDKGIRSTLAKQRGQVVQVTWHQSLPGVVFPGMGVKFMYANEGQIFTRYGVLLGEVYHAAMSDGSMASDRVSTVSELTLWLSSDK